MMRRTGLTTWMRTAAWPWLRDHMYAACGDFQALQYRDASANHGRSAGIKPLGLNDALQPPMTDIFSTQQAAWTYKARVPAILRTTKLPLPAATVEDKAGAASLVPGHDAAYWADKTKDFDFSAEDKLDSESFTWCCGPVSRATRNRTPLNAMAGT